MALRLLRAGNPIAAPYTAVPNGIAGTWSLKFEDDFNGTSLDPAKWTAQNGRTMNNVTTSPAQATVSGGNLILQLDAGATTGALVTTGVDFNPQVAPFYRLPVGGVVEMRAYFPGESGEHIYNWPALWTSGENWPNDGEHDFAEGLGGELTVVYHYWTGSAEGITNSGEPINPVTGLKDWFNSWHTYALHRKASSADVYYDGYKLKTYATSDPGNGHTLMINIGKSGSRTPVTGLPGALLVDYVRAWEPA